MDSNRLNKYIKSVFLKSRLTSEYSNSFLPLFRNLFDRSHEKISAKVEKRLNNRYKLLETLEKKVKNLQVHNELTQAEVKISENKNKLVATSVSSEDKNISHDASKDHTLSPGVRAYHLAVTDLFVEKALAYLENRAYRYKRLGYVTYFFALTIVAFGAGLAVFQMLCPPPLNYYVIVKLLNSSTQPLDSENLLKPIKEFSNQLQYIPAFTPHGFTSRETIYIDGFLSFAKSFTAYGMIVLMAVKLIRFGKALLGQAERLLERRHALRQGRLFVHLNDGKLSIDDLEKAFNWNTAGTNAFSDIPTESQAPWGTVLNLNVLKEVLPQLIKEGLAARRLKKDEKDEKDKT